MVPIFVALLTCLTMFTGTASAQTSEVVGTVRDETGGALPGVIVELRAAGGTASQAETDTRGAYRFDRLAAGPAQLSFALINFASARRERHGSGSRPRARRT